MKNANKESHVSHSKRTKKMWSSSGTQLSLKVWSRHQTDPDVLGWLVNKAAKPFKKVKIKFSKKSSAENELAKGKK